MSKKFQLQIPDPCHEDWAKMNPLEQGRFCNSCQKAVVDFTGMSDAQLVAFFKKPSTGSLCGRFNNDQLQRDITVPRKRLPWLRYLLHFTIPVFLTSLKAQSQGNIEKISTVISPACTNGLQGRAGAVPVKLPSKKIYGRVTDENGNGLPFASVIIKGSGEGVICDSTGFFELNGKDAKEYTLVASCVGYTETKTDVNAKHDRSVEIRLTMAASLNGEVVVTAMEYTRKGTVTGYAVTSQKSSLQKIKSFFAADSISVYPNPAKPGSHLKIEFRKQRNGEYIVDLFTIQGQLVKSFGISPVDMTTSFDFQLPSLTPGIYILNVTSKSSGKRFSEKIIIQ